MQMSVEEMAVKVVMGKHIIEDMLADPFWTNLIGRDAERLMNSVQQSLESLPYEGKPKTDEEASDLLFRWTLPVRGAVLLEFQDKVSSALGEVTV